MFDGVDFYTSLTHARFEELCSRAIRRLRTACERARCTLSSAVQTTIEIDAVKHDVDFYSSRARAHFEELFLRSLTACLQRS